jgi:hypothetical protein
MESFVFIISGSEEKISPKLETQNPKTARVEMSLLQVTSPSAIGVR